MSDSPADAGGRRPWLAFAVLAAAISTGIAGIEMILPLVPGLPAALSGSPEQAQLVIASYVGGGALGTICFGELGARFDGRRLLAVSLLAYAGLAFTAASRDSLSGLILVRLVQGAAGAAALAFAPGMIRALFPGLAGVRAMGGLSGIAGVAAILSPIVGQYVGGRFGWRVAFALPGAIALATGLAAAAFGRALPRFAPVRLRAFWPLFRRPAFTGAVLNQAFAQAAFLSFAFGAPAVLAGGRGPGAPDFVVLRVSGIAVYVVGTTLAWRVSRRLGAGRAVLTTTAISTVATGGAAVGLLAGGGTFPVLLASWLALSPGQGAREPAAQMRIVEGSSGDPARSIAFTGVLGLALAAGLTAAAAPLVRAGPLPLASTSLLAWCLSLAMLRIRPRP